MTYEFLDVIDHVIASLDYKANKAKKALINIDTRQVELKAELAALEPRQHRAHVLKSRDDLICAYCFILHGNEFPLRPIPGDDSVDRFRCGECGAKCESNF